MATMTGVLLDTYTHPFLGQRGRITVNFNDGQTLYVESPGEELEEPGAGPHIIQFDRAVGLAREMNIPLNFVNHNLLLEVTSIRKEG